MLCYAMFNIESRAIMSGGTILLSNFTHSPIDIHSHFNHGSRFDYPNNENHIRGIYFIESVYRNVSVSQVGISKFPSVFKHTECIIAENKYLHKLIDEKEWVY